MKRISTLGYWTLACAVTLCAPAAANATVVYETEAEYLAAGDFNGDGKTDVLLVDRGTGRLRIGYRMSAEFFNWANWRAGGVADVTGVSVGRMLDGQRDAIALAAANANLLTVVDAANPDIHTDPIRIPSAALGPNTIVAADLGGAGNTPLLDLYVNSVYNAEPTPNRLTLFRNTAGRFSQTVELPATGGDARGNRLALKTGGPEFVVVITEGEAGNSLRAVKLDSGRPEEVLTLPGVPSYADYVTGNFSSPQLKDFVFYTAGEPELRVGTLTETGGKFTAAALKTITLDRPLRHLVTVPGESKSRLLAVFGEAEPAEVMDFDGVNPPVSVQKLAGATNKFLNTCLALPDAVLLFSTVTNYPVRAAGYYQMYLLADGSYTSAGYGGLPSLADRDDSTVPLIYTNIVARSLGKTVADMKSYTNTLPGSTVKYQMVAIPGGEFTMGSPDQEPNRKDDEGPRHKVKIAPFWMGRFEVTWDQFLLFMYPDDEKKLREAHPTDAAIDALSDAVTRPSKPYVDMSFGMGKSAKAGGIGFPAIAMTHHAANKFCHWLSAKTGHFYRLPTEAEWEYACRAGTTTAYSFGDDATKLKDHAWFFDNSNSKYQEVGKKLPNPWGLYDMHGNVMEWVLDQYDPDYYQVCATKGVVSDPWNRATQPYPLAARGGSWDDDPEQLRSAARRGSDRVWKATDPMLPKGMWYLTDNQLIGFRIVRPLAIPTPEEMARYWISGVEKD